MTSPNDLVLSGLDGGNPLGFLAALGTLRTATRLEPSARLGWSLADGWRPFLRSGLTRVELAAALHDELARLALVGWPETGLGSERALAKDLTLPVTEYREWIREALGQGDDLRMEWAAALASDGAPRRDGSVQDTELRTMSGAGHQHFLETFRTLAGETSVGQLEEALFGPWRYRDTGSALRWDPADDRRHALRWGDPSKEPNLTVRGANRLAVEAVPLFPVVPVASKARTVGFTSRQEAGERAWVTWWTWPIWGPPLSTEAVKTILSLRELQAVEVDRERLRELGILEVYRARRVTEGKFRNFTPAVAAASVVSSSGGTP